MQSILIEVQPIQSPSQNHFCLGLLTSLVKMYKSTTCFRRLEFTYLGLTAHDSILILGMVQRQGCNLQKRHNMKDLQIPFDYCVLSEEVTAKGNLH